jgi:hypothetical protein
MPSSGTRCRTVRETRRGIAQAKVSAAHQIEISCWAMGCVGPDLEEHRSLQNKVIAVARLAEAIERPADRSGPPVRGFRPGYRHWCSSPQPRFHLRVPFFQRDRASGSRWHEFRRCLRKCRLIAAAAFDRESGNSVPLSQSCGHKRRTGAQPIVVRAGFVEVRGARRLIVSQSASG